MGKSNFSKQFRKLTSRYKRIGYSLDIMRQIGCGKMKVLGIPQLQVAVSPSHKEEKERDTIQYA